MSTWLTVRCLNRKPKTQLFYRELHGLILKHWPDVALPAAELSANTVLRLAASLAGVCCPSRWNAFVSFIRGISPHGKLRSRLRLNVRHFVPPSQAELDRKSVV